MLKVRDIMTKGVISVKKDTPIYDAVEMLLTNQITGVPVVEEDMTLAGILTEKDALRLFYATEEEKNKTAEYFMTKPAVHYNENDSLQTICDFMMINYFRRVPVTSKAGKVVGIISRPDVLKYILEKRRSEISNPV
jgi:CBS domain-containing protein